MKASTTSTMRTKPAEPTASPADGQAIDSHPGTAGAPSAQSKGRSATLSTPATGRVDLPQVGVEPLIHLEIVNAKAVYHPGELLVSEVQIESSPANPVTAVEASVMWYTEGKGDEDLAVHFFERRTRSEKVPTEVVDLHASHRFETPLPNSPMSYPGAIVKLRWCVRARVFLKGGREITTDVDFRLCPPPR